MNLLIKTNRYMSRKKLKMDKLNLELKISELVQDFALSNNLEVSDISVNTLFETVGDERISICTKIIIEL